MLPESGSITNKQKIVYVEDNLSNVMLVEELLGERPNVELLVAKSGEAALDLARRSLPSLILLDLHLPGLSGREVLGHLKRDAATSLIPVVVISADATKRQIERLLAEGARDYLTKPIDVPEFFRVIDCALTEKDSNTQRAAA
jgi:CheY-like chemotaxis protein